MHQYDSAVSSAFRDRQLTSRRRSSFSSPAYPRSTESALSTLIRRCVSYWHFARHGGLKSDSFSPVMRITALSVRLIWLHCRCGKRGQVWMIPRMTADFTAQLVHFRIAARYRFTLSGPARKMSPARYVLQNLEYSPRIGVRSVVKRQPPSCLQDPANVTGACQCRCCGAERHNFTAVANAIILSCFLPHSTVLKPRPYLFFGLKYMTKESSVFAHM